jgi:hypothetical protein
MKSIHECQFTECEYEWEWAFSRYFRTECELKISKTTHSPHQFSQKLSKTSFIPSLFYIQDYIIKTFRVYVTIGTTMNYRNRNYQNRNYQNKNYQNKNYQNRIYLK